MNARLLFPRALAAGGMVLLLLWPSMSPALGRNTTYDLSVLSAAGVTAIIVISLNLAMGYSGLLSMTHTGLLAVGGYGVGILSLRVGLPASLSLLSSIAVTTAVAAVVVLVSIRATSLYFGLITLSFDLVIVTTAQQWTPVTGGFYGLAGIQRPDFGQGPLNNPNFFYLVLLAVLVAYVFQRNIVRSPIGRSFQAVRESPETAASLGVDPSRARVLAFAMSGTLAGLAGGLYAQQLQFISPDAGALTGGLTLFIALFLGGAGTLVGPILGVVAITAIQLGIRDYARYTQLILGVVLLLAMLVLPRGIVGTWRNSRFAPPPGARVQLAGFRSPAHPRRSPPPPAAPSEPAAPAHADGASREGSVPDVPVLTATGLVKTYGGVAAVADVDLDVRPGEVHGVIGPNGAGKSTLVGCLAGQIRPDAGRVLLLGKPSPSRPHLIARTGLTRVFQVPHLFQEVSILDNVLAGMDQRNRSSWWAAVLRLPGYRRQEAFKRTEATRYLALAELSARADWSASTLSHGQKRLVEVVRAAATRPRLLVLDEPATGLTPLELNALATFVHGLRDGGMSILLIEHNMDFVMALCDRVTVLHLGRVIHSGTPAEVQASPEVQEAYLGHSPDRVPT